MRDSQRFFSSVYRTTDPVAQKQIPGSRYTVIGTSDRGARPHSADRQEYSTQQHWVREPPIMRLEGPRRKPSITLSSSYRPAGFDRLTNARGAFGQIHPQRVKSGADGVDPLLQPG